MDATGIATTKAKLALGVQITANIGDGPATGIEEAQILLRSIAATDEALEEAEVVTRARFCVLLLPLIRARMPSRLRDSNNGCAGIYDCLALSVKFIVDHARVRANVSAPASVPLLPSVSRRSNRCLVRRYAVCRRSTRMVPKYMAMFAQEPHLLSGDSTIISAFNTNL